MIAANKIEKTKSAATKNFVELFCGKAEMSKTFKAAGYNICSLDKRQRKNTCEPTIKTDILNFSIDQLPFSKVNILWASPPCTAFSRAAGKKYFENGTFNNKAEPFIKILEKTCSIISELQPEIWWIENPNCRLKNIASFREWLKKNNGVHYAITLSSYGFPTTKPTSLFTNCNIFMSRPLHNFGRGFKCTRVFNNLSTIQRQTIPQALCEEILYYSKLQLSTNRIEKQIQL